MAAPIYKGGRPFFKPGVRLPNAIVIALQGAGAPTSGTSGTGAGVAGPGSIYINTTGGAWYVNSNTKASPTWTIFDTAAGLSLTSAHLFVGNGSGLPADVAASGDVTLANTGAFTVVGLNSSATSTTGAEANVLHSVTAGTITASKAVVVDANKDVSSFHKVTYTQQLSHAAEATQTKSANYTMAATDSGYITEIDTDAVVITLPSTAVGLSFVFRNKGASDGAVGFNISPAAADKIQGVGLTAADNKDLINTKATAKVGDMVAIVADGVDGWFVQRLHGTWAREA